ncbi:sterol desaturase family protein [Maricaulis maris]|uniref:Sterol desaturase/sphingolipid hydroxylase (Fatty acid hydroxylase superfamily) n=1 Tax=Maricaulis maris TaxID=74318 RepID=A0A495DJC3_9PROT|nr:sterol desaturase family protein [Maricaulis maris]RKR02731.1 sterol desaturase/sphingolipid hydroxylase (fatty acid hydroxylase superfamily) [Maricaulis maris]
MDVPAFVQNWNPITLAIPFFTLSVFAEMLHARLTGKTRFETRDTAASLVMGLGNNVSSIVFGILLGGWSVFVYEHRLLDISFAWWVWVIAFVLDDFLYYWSHRFAHTVRWFWADHIVHHSSQHYNLTTALRQPWISPLTLKFLWLGSAMVFLGFHPAMVAFVGALNLIYQFWIHTEAIKRCPAWFEAVMNTPSHHRVHHATNPIYLDKNYAGIFIIWDKMFGTFQVERADEPCRYGIVKNLGTYNPIKICLHEWMGIVNDMAGAKSLKHAAMYLLAPPGWSPDGSRETSKQLLAKWQARQAAQPKPEAEAAE